MSAWFPHPPMPLLVDAAEPYLVLESRLDEFRGYLTGADPGLELGFRLGVTLWQQASWQQASWQQAFSRARPRP